MGYTASTETRPKKWKLSVEQAHPDHAYALAPHIREADRQEAMCHFPDENVDMGDLLALSVATSHQAFTISDNEGKIHGLWGHGPWLEAHAPQGVGNIWLVSDDVLFKKYPKTMTWAARKQIFPMLDKTYAMYGNLVASFNLVHARWLLRSGFHRAGGSVFYGGQPFSLYLRTA